jgi:methyltransferase
MGVFQLTPQRWAILAILGAIGALRLGELIFSHWRLRQDRQAGHAASIAEPLFPWMVAVHSAWYVGTALESWLASVELPVWSLTLCAGLWIGSLALRGWLWANLGRLWSVRLVTRDQQRIVTTGPYTWVRHPNYLAVILEIATVPILLGAVWTAVLGTVANGAVVGLRIRREEQYLFSRPGYAEAFGHKKRLLPGIF